MMTDEEWATVRMLHAMKIPLQYRRYNLINVPVAEYDSWETWNTQFEHTDFTDLWRPLFEFRRKPE